MNNQEFKYLTDYIKDKNAKIGICALVGKISPKISSHKAAWCFMLANQIENAGYKPGEEVKLALDCASAEFYVDGKYDYTKFEGDKVLS